MISTLFRTNVALLFREVDEHRLMLFVPSFNLGGLLSFNAVSIYLLMTNFVSINSPFLHVKGVKYYFLLLFVLISIVIFLYYYIRNNYLRLIESHFSIDDLTRTKNIRAYEYYRALSVLLFLLAILQYSA